MLHHFSVLSVSYLVFLFDTCYGQEGYIPSFRLLSPQTSVLLFLTCNASLSFPGLPLEALGLKSDKSTNTGECRHCKEMKYFLKYLTHLCFCTEGQGSHEIWNKSEFLFQVRYFGLLPFFAACALVCFVTPSHAFIQRTSTIEIQNMAASLVSRCLCCVAHAFLCLLGPLLSRSKRQIKVLEDVHKRFMTCGVHACCAGVAPVARNSAL